MERVSATGLALSRREAASASVPLAIKHEKHDRARPGLR